METALIISCIFLAASILGWYFAHQNMQNMRAAWECVRKELTDMTDSWKDEYEKRCAYENAIKQAKRDAQEAPHA